MQENLRIILSDLNQAGVQFEIEEEITVLDRRKSESGVENVSGSADSLPAKSPMAFGSQNGRQKSALDTCGADDEATKTLIPKMEPVGTGVLASEAQTVAADAESMEELLAAIKAFDKMPTAKMAKGIIGPKVGSMGGVLVVVDAPSKADDEAGELLSGEARELFSKMMAAIGIDSEDVSVFPVMFHKLPGDRTPTSDELAVTRAFFDRFVEFLGPTHILTFGQTAFSFVVPGGGNIPKVHGQAFGNVVPTFGLKTLMTRPEFKKEAWADLQKFREAVGD